MGRRAEGLQLRGGTWWLRVQVPDDVRAVFGKLEVHNSLKTGDHAEAKRRARYDRLNLDAERLRLRRLREIVHRDELDDREIEDLARGWFVAEEKKRQGVSLTSEEIREAEIDLTHMMEWDEIGGSVTSAIDNLLESEGSGRLPSRECSRTVL